MRLYKLPQASETVADPHNLFLEMWATAGTPAVVLFVALLIGFAVDVSAAARTASAPQNSDDEPPVAPAKWIVFGGALIGLALGPWISCGTGILE